MNCPHCHSKIVIKNGHRRSKQCYLCKTCGRQFIDSYSVRGYSDDAKQICLKMYQNGLGLRAIERLTGVGHNTISNWIQQAELTLLQDAEIEKID